MDMYTKTAKIFDYTRHLSLKTETMTVGEMEMMLVTEELERSVNHFNKA